MSEREPAVPAAGSPSGGLFGSILAVHIAVAVLSVAAAGLLTAAAATSMALILLVRLSSLSALALLIRLSRALCFIAVLSRVVRALIAAGHIDTPGVAVCNHTVIRFRAAPM
jgi:hypothetical protein